MLLGLLAVVVLSPGQTEALSGKFASILKNHNDAVIDVPYKITTTEDGNSSIPFVMIVDNDKATKIGKGLYVAPSIRGYLHYNLVGQL